MFKMRKENPFDLCRRKIFIFFVLSPWVVCLIIGYNSCYIYLTGFRLFMVYYR